MPKGWLIDALGALASYLLSPFALDFWEYLLFGVRGLVTYAALHGSYLTWRYGADGPTRIITSIAMAGMGWTYLMLLVVQLPWYQMMSLATPLALLRDAAVLIVLTYHLRHHKWLVVRRRR